MTTYRIISQLNLYDLETIFEDVYVDFDDGIWTVYLIGYEQNIDRIMLKSIALSRRQYQIIE